MKIIIVLIREHTGSKVINSTFSSVLGGKEVFMLTFSCGTEVLSEGREPTVPVCSIVTFIT